jgi:hypothetical protein
MMTLPITRVPERQDTIEPAAPPAPRKRRRWDAFFADPAAIEADYHRLARRHQERSATMGGRRP